MTLRVVGASPPRTGNGSLGKALETLLGEPCYDMREAPGWPFYFGNRWATALAGGTPDWDEVYDGYVAALGWPTSLFWRELSSHYPESLVVLATRDSTDTWLDSMEATLLPIARAVAPEGWIGGRDLAVMMERFAGPPDWEDRAALGAAYDDWLAQVRAEADPARFVEWQVVDGWEPLCAALGVPVPATDFPWLNRREDWLH